MRTFALGLLLVLLVASCKWNLPWVHRKNLPPTPSPTPEMNEILLPLPGIEGNSEIFDSWFSYLLQPRLGFLNELKATCQQDPRTLNLKFSFDANSFFRCDDLISANSLDARWKCLSPTQIQVTLPTSGSLTRCENLAQFSELARSIKLPYAPGLYKIGPSHSLVPSAPISSLDPTQNLPILRWNSSTPPQGDQLALSFPSYEDWLKNSFESGAIALVLEIDSKNGDDQEAQLALYFLLRLITQQKEPSKFRFYLNPTNLSAPQKKVSTPVPFFTIQSNEKDPQLFRESCEYVNKWLKSQQILAGLDPATNPLQTLHCVFKWGGKSLFSHSSLTLTKLPLPLVYTNANGNEIFPFRFLQDGLSSSAFRSLKKP